MHVLAIWSLKGKSIEQDLPSPDLACSRSSLLSIIPTKMSGVTLPVELLPSSSFAPHHFCFQDAVIVILQDTRCNTGIGKLSWGKERAPDCLLFSVPNFKCVGRNLETSTFREGRSYQSLYWWCLAFCEKQTVPVAVALRIRWQLEDGSYCPVQMLLLGCCRSRVLVLRWLYCLPFRVYLAMPFVSMPTTLEHIVS